MNQPILKRAIILAAGRGSRLVSQDVFPKPLKKVAGVPLIVRILRTLQSEGIREVVLVIGFRGEQIRQQLLNERSLQLKLIFVENTRFDQSNGISLLAASAYIDQECLLSMADHLYSPELVRTLLTTPTWGLNALAVDSNISSCFDLDDATKVKQVDNLIVNIHKELGEYDSLDTGVFKITPALIHELARLDAQHGDCSLSDGVKALAQQKKFLAINIGDARWIDVDTPEAFAQAEIMIRNGENFGSGSVQPYIPRLNELYESARFLAAQPCTNSS